MESVTGDDEVVVLDNEDVYSVSSGDATGWEGDKVEVGEGETSLADLSNGEKLEVSKVGSLSDSNAYTNTGDHTQETNTSDGAVIVLDDGSVWSIPESSDQTTASRWQDNAAIAVSDNGGPGNSYQLINTDDEESVTAKYIGEK